MYPSHGAGRHGVYVCVAPACLQHAIGVRHHIPRFTSHIPGYPTVSRDNDYLFARQDGAIIDAKPWGRGPGPPGTPWPLLPQPGTPTKKQWLADAAQQQALQQVQWEELEHVCEVGGHGVSGTLTTTPNTTQKKKHTTPPNVHCACTCVAPRP